MLTDVLFGGDCATADLVSTVTDHAQVHDRRIGHVRFPIVQRRLKVVGESQTQVGKFTFADQRPGTARCNTENNHDRITNSKPSQTQNHHKLKIITNSTTCHKLT
jgi:hypothetical protein